MLSNSCLPAQNNWVTLAKLLTTNGHTSLCSQLTTKIFLFPPTYYKPN